MLPGLISSHLVSSLSSILAAFVSNLHDYAIVSNLETHPNQIKYATVKIDWISIGILVK